MTVEAMNDTVDGDVDIRAIDGEHKSQCIWAWWIVLDVAVRQSSDITSHMYINTSLQIKCRPQESLKLETVSQKHSYIL